MKKVSKKDIEVVLAGIIKSGNDELFSKKEAELEEYWFFKWEQTAPATWNIYQFNKLLTLYGSFCRRWEEHHNGTCCVVERVRDKYLMPKIRAFLVELKANII